MHTTTAFRGSSAYLNIYAESQLTCNIILATHPSSSCITAPGMIIKTGSRCCSASDTNVCITSRNSSSILVSSTTTVHRSVSGALANMESVRWSPDDDESLRTDLHLNIHIRNFVDRFKRSVEPTPLHDCGGQFSAMRNTVCDSTHPRLHQAWTKGGHSKVASEACWPGGVNVVNQRTKQVATCSESLNASTRSSRFTPLLRRKKIRFIVYYLCARCKYRWLGGLCL